MDLLQSIDYMLKIAVERHPDKRFNQWARRFYMKINRTEKAWIKAQNVGKITGPWDLVHCAMLCWFDSNDPAREKASAAYLKKTCEDRVREFMLSENIPREHYSL